MLPRRGKQGSRGPLALRNGPGRLPYERRLPHGRLPRSVDWRGTGADGIVKDQAACGSCWAFSTTGALQSAAWMATGGSLGVLSQSFVCLDNLLQVRVIMSCYAANLGVLAI